MPSRTLLALAVTAVLIVGSCSTQEPTAESMNEAVMSAASSLLASPFVLVATERSGSGDVLRSQWLDYRSNEDFRQVFGSRIDGELSALGWIVVAGERFCATSGAGDACAFDVAADQAKWASYGQVAAPAGDTKQILDVLADRFVERRLESSGVDRAKIGRTDGPNGLSTWALSVPLASGLEHWTWTIDSEGRLIEMTIRGEGILAVDRFEDLRVEFTSSPSPVSIMAPEPGASFDLGAFPIPDGVPLLTG